MIQVNAKCCFILIVLFYKMEALIYDNSIYNNWILIPFHDRFQGCMEPNEERKRLTFPWRVVTDPDNGSIANIIGQSPFSGQDDFGESIRDHRPSCVEVSGEKNTPHWSLDQCEASDRLDSLASPPLHISEPHSEGSARSGARSSKR